MAEKKNESSNNNRKVVAEEKKDNGGGDKKNEDSNSFKSVYKIGLHCEGCATKIKRCVKDFQGVEDVKAEVALNKLTVVGKVDPTKLRYKLSQKTKMDVELISPLPPKKDNGGVEKKNEDSNSFKSVYKIDMHCEGCATKIKRCVKDFQGVEDVKVEMVLNKLTVVGKVDPTMLRYKLSQKTKNDVELISPLPPKDNGGVEKKNEDSNSKEDVELISPLPSKKDNGGVEKKNEDSNSKEDVELVSPLPPKKDNKAAADDNKPDKKPKDKKPKETPVKTSFFKLSLHSEGCIRKISKFVLNTKGLQEMTVDKEKDLVMVKGTMDVKALAKGLRNRIKRTVKIVPPKKVKDSGGRRGDGNKKDDNGDGSGGGKTKGGGGDAGQEEDGGGKNRMDVFGHPGFGYYDHGYGYGNGFVNGYGHANGWEWEWICAWILRTLYPWVATMHQICSVKKTQMLALSCEEGKIVF